MVRKLKNPKIKRKKPFAGGAEQAGQAGLTKVFKLWGITRSGGGGHRSHHRPRLRPDRSGGQYIYGKRGMAAGEMNPKLPLRWKDYLTLRALLLHGHKQFYFWEEDKGQRF